MSDWYGRLATNPRTKNMVRSLGLPVPARLRRYEPGAPLLPAPALVGGSGRVRAEIERLLKEEGVEIASAAPDASSDQKLGALIYDASTLADAAELGDVFEFFNGAIRSLASSGRFLVIGEPPCDVRDPRRGAAARALEGFVRSAGKEMRGGSTANLIRVGEGAEASIASTLAFFLSGRSAYVSGQPVVLSSVDAPQQTRPTLADQTICVTGAARGIGAAIADVMAREGAHVICIDIPAQGSELARTANSVGGTALQLDITNEDAPRRLVDHIESRHGGIDAIVHNAGITRDKTLAGMDRARWDSVLDVNLLSQERIDAQLLSSAVLAPNGRIISVSSVSGIAGNRGQTNYAASKAGVIGRVKTMAPQMRERGGTVNAVAPGFIETAMTARMPFGVREAGRRMNSLSQGGLPIDVAETIAWLADPASVAVNGNVVRVCGQSLIGA